MTKTDETPAQRFWRMVDSLPFIIPTDDPPLFIRCECGLNVKSEYKTCPACGRELKKGKENEH